MAIYNEKHEEIPDPTPVEMPLGYEKPESLESMIARMIQSANRVAAQSGQIETFEEADDFGEDDDDLKSPYQMSDMQEEQPIYVQPRKQSNSQPAESGQKATQEPSPVQTVQPGETAPKVAQAVAAQ